MADTGPLNSRSAAHKSWANTRDRSARTAPARQAFRDKFLNQVDPHRQMTDADREKAAESARKAFFLDLSKKSQAAREARKAEAAEATKPAATARRLAREAAAAQAAAEAAATVAVEAARKAAVALAAATGAAVAAQEAPDDDGGQEHCPRCGAPIPPGDF